MYSEQLINRIATPWQPPNTVTST